MQYGVANIEAELFAEAFDVEKAKAELKAGREAREAALPKLNKAKKGQKITILGKTYSVEGNHGVTRGQVHLTLKGARGVHYLLTLPRDAKNMASILNTGGGGMPRSKNLSVADIKLESLGLEGLRTRLDEALPSMADMQQQPRRPRSRPAPHAKQFKKGMRVDTPKGPASVIGAVMVKRVIGGKKKQAPSVLVVLDSKKDSTPQYKYTGDLFPITKVQPLKESRLTERSQQKAKLVPMHTVRDKDLVMAVRTYPLLKREEALDRLRENLAAC